MNRIILFLLTATLVANAAEPPRKLVCVGRVEPVDGELDVSAQLSGTLIDVPVKEGDWVTKGTLLAVVDAPREKAALDLALAKLARVKAGNGKEEIAAAAAMQDAIAAELAFAEIQYNRALKLREGNAQAISEEMLDERRQQSETLRKKLASAASQHDALKRGVLPEDTALAEAEGAAAHTAYGLREVRAVTAGFVLTLHKHTGDNASLNFPSAILRMADTRHLRVRLEVSEQEAAAVKAGMAGVFTPHGSNKPAGKLRVTTVLPAFAPRRLFEPDSTARMDTRTLQVLCEIVDGSMQVYAGQRVLVSFLIGE